jgi:hypothetical protein
MQWLTFGPFMFESARGVLLRDGRPMPVNQKGIRLLAALLLARGNAVSKTALMDAAWPGTAVEESNLSIQIAASASCSALIMMAANGLRRFRALVTDSPARCRAQILRRKTPTPPM